MSTEDTDTPQTPEGENPHPRRRSPLAVASVAAAVLLAGGGGAYWASTAAGGGQDPGAAQKDGSPKPLALDGYGSPGRVGIAPGEPNPYGRQYKAAGKLPDGPESASVYRTGAKVSKAEVARLAKALDVAGSPRADGGVWKVGGAKDAMGPVLRVSQKAPGGWSYTAYGSPGGTSCVQPPDTGSGAQPSDTQSPDAEGSDKSCPSYRGGATDSKGSGSKGDKGSTGSDKAVSEARAKRAAQPVLDALGLDGAKLDATRLYGAVRVVQANPVLDDLPTHGWQTSLQVGADGQLVGGAGLLSKPAKDDTYPLIGAAEAIKQLNKGDAASDSADSGPAEPQKADKPEKAAKGAKADTVTVRKATLGLAARSVDGRRALVPSWLFQIGSSSADDAVNTVSYPAVDPKFIKKPSPSGTSPSTGPGKDHVEDITSYTVDGKSLTVRFWGGVCESYSVSAKESSSQVKLEIKAKRLHPGRPCILIAKQIEKKVELDKPLGDRKVVDARTGETVPKRT
ncbi:hypothetical protein [Streptomyces sp. ME19-01-6]|uniref:hypothetical protein n=1 Tax=Streptomyces sp. ME19-01-6 TaxID=3028686 RepID=UPI0029B1F9DA|nr:hypothetical protein [Streptomyces sp. ME19-01-6]MDX3232689.1 hypothetical protein [Streptomyces sp. ME19-01-6]